MDSALPAAGWGSKSTLACDTPSYDWYKGTYGIDIVYSVSTPADPRCGHFKLENVRALRLLAPAATDVTTAGDKADQVSVSQPTQAMPLIPFRSGVLFRSGASRERIRLIAINVGRFLTATKGGALEGDAGGGRRDRACCCAAWFPMLATLCLLKLHKSCSSYCSCPP